MDVAEAQHLMEGLDWQGAVKDIGASVKWLKENGSKKVSSILVKFKMVCWLRELEILFVVHLLLPYYVFYFYVV